MRKKDFYFYHGLLFYVMLLSHFLKLTISSFPAAAAARHAVSEWAVRIPIGVFCLLLLFWSVFGSGRKGDRLFPARKKQVAVCGAVLLLISTALDIYTFRTAGEFGWLVGATLILVIAVPYFSALKTSLLPD